MLQYWLMWMLPLIEYLGRQHIRNALKYGATVEEILEVLEMISALGIHSCTFGIPILMDEIKKYKESSAKTK